MASPKAEELKKLLETKTNQEAAEFYGVNTKTVARWRKTHGLTRAKVLNLPDELSPEEQQIVVGCLLGDGCIPHTKPSQGNRFEVKQKTSRRSYLEHLELKLRSWATRVTDEKPIRAPIQKNRRIINNPSGKNWNGKYCSASRLYTARSKAFADLRRKWYKSEYDKYSPKIVPQDIKLDWLAVAHWFVNDGNNNGQKKTISFATQSFGQDSRDLLVSKLCNLGVRCWTTKTMEVVLKVESYDFFLDAVEPYIKEMGVVFHYKLIRNASRKAPYKTRASNEAVIKVLALYKQDFSYEEIAGVCNLNKNTVGRIIRNSLGEIEAIPVSKDTAIVSVIYNAKSSEPRPESADKVSADKR
jgi:hypothetical protein